MKPIPNYEGYFATEDGRIYSVRGNHGTAPLKEIYQGTNIKTDYKFVIFWYNNRPSTKSVHRLVAMAFLGKPSNKNLEIRHLDGNRHNNNVSNLLWGSRKENCQDTIRHGRTTKGSKNKASKLIEEQVAIIKKSDDSSELLAKKFGVCGRTIRNIRNSKSWTHV
jgi:hypothetical protein